MARIAWNKGITKLTPKPCICGCGEMLKIHKYLRADGGITYTINKFIKGHEKRGMGGFDRNVHVPRSCFCGCGTFTKKQRGHYCIYIKGHENIGRVPWNKGKQFSQESRLKTSIARLGKEPANKAIIDKEMLYDLYVTQKKNASQVSEALGVSRDSVKNRLQDFGWSRTTKESCNSEYFKGKMRSIRVRVLSSGKIAETPNLLERTVYDFMDLSGVFYQRQVPLFNKFVVDLFFPKQKLVVEVFGRYWHELPVNLKKDFSKKKYLEKCGYNLEVLWDYEIKKIGLPELFNRLNRKYSLL